MTATASLRGSSQGRKTAWAGFIGTVLEYYDFLIYGSASALILNRLFFPQEDPAVAVIASLATFGVGYVARPLGAFVFGHLGDRIGRRQTLIITLLGMGIATLVVGLLPTYAEVGVLAPALLVTCRIVQGISAGGESAGAATLTLEHAGEGRRGFLTSFTSAGSAAGIALAQFVFIPFAALPDEILLGWAWRVPFLLSGFVIAFGLYARIKLEETPTFEAAKKSDQVARLPMAVLFRTQWRQVLRVFFGAFYSVPSTVFSVFGLLYATTVVGIEASTMLWVSALGFSISACTTVFNGWLSDRLGRRPVWAFCTLGAAAMGFAYFWALGTQIIPLVFVTGILFISLINNGIWAVAFPEQFRPQVRYSGFAIGSQVGLAITGFAPTIGYALLQPGELGWVPVVIFSSLCSVVACIAMVTARETYRVPADQLGIAESRGLDR